MTEYRFEFRGEIQEGRKPKLVKLELAKLFEVTVNQLDELFTGESIFIRDPLDKHTATQYKSKFASVGAIGHICSTKDKKQIKITSCDKRTNDNKSSESKEPRKNLTTFQESHVKKEDNTEYLELRKDASKWLSISVTAILVVSIFDYYLGQYLSRSTGGYDIGYFPYFIAHALLAYGCIQYASAKGHSFSVGLLGILSFAGLSIILLLPDKINNDNKNSPARFLFAALCISYSVYWVTQQLAGSVQANRLEDNASLLTEGREIYPSNIIQSDPETYRAEFEELKIQVIETLNVITQNNYRRKKTKEVIETLMQALVDYRRWQDYQTFLHSIHNKQLPIVLSGRSLDKKMREIKKTFDEHLPSSGGQSTINVVIQEWYSGKESLWTKPNKALEQLFDMTELIRKELQIKNRIVMTFDDGPKSPKIDLSHIHIENTSHIKVDLSENTITLKVRLSATQSRTVIWGVFPYKDPNYKGRDYYLDKTVLYCDIKNYFLRDELNPLRIHETPGVRYMY